MGSFSKGNDMGEIEMYIDFEDTKARGYKLYWDDSEWNHHREVFQNKRILLERLGNLLEQDIYKLTITKN